MHIQNKKLIAVREKLSETQSQRRSEPGYNSILMTQSDFSGVFLLDEPFWLDINKLSRQQKLCMDCSYFTEAFLGIDNTKVIKSWDRISNPKNFDAVVYGGSNHWGVYFNGRVISKWGEGGLVSYHGKVVVPPQYGAPEFFSNPNSFPENTELVDIFKAVYRQVIKNFEEGNPLMPEYKDSPAVAAFIEKYEHFFD